jgi:hypothetical protein
MKTRLRMAAVREMADGMAMLKVSANLCRDAGLTAQENDLNKLCLDLQVVLNSVMPTAEKGTSENASAGRPGAGAEVGH